MQDTIVMLAERGHGVEWLMNLDMCQLDALAESSERLEARRRLTKISDGRQIAHCEKKSDIQQYLAPLKQASQIPKTPEQVGDILAAAQR